MSEHTVSAYDEELTEMAGKIAEMGGLAEKAFADAVHALVSQDLALAKSTIANDVRLDALHQEVEVKLIEIIARRQPMGQDLREVTAATRIANDLERVGDLAKNVAKRVIAIDSDLQSKKLAIGVEHMTELALSQLKQVLDAYTRKDAETAAQGPGSRCRSGRDLHLAVPRAADLHDGRPAGHHPVRASAVLRQEHRAHR